MFLEFVRLEINAQIALSSSWHIGVGLAKCTLNPAALGAGVQLLKNPADEYFFYGRRANIQAIVDDLLG